MVLDRILLGVLQEELVLLEMEAALTMALAKELVADQEEQACSGQAEEVLQRIGIPITTVLVHPKHMLEMVKVVQFGILI